MTSLSETSCRKYWNRTCSWPSCTEVSSVSIPRRDGPLTRVPSRAKVAPWQGQTNWFLSMFQGTVQPRWGQTDVSTRSWPWLSFVTYTAFSEIALRQPSTCSIRMVRMAGAVRDENSRSSPTDELLSSVVRRSKGKSAKRMSGTESRALTKTEPTPSNAPRKERLFSRGNPDAEGFATVVSESPADAHIEFSPCHGLQADRTPRAGDWHESRTYVISLPPFPGCRRPVA